MNITPDSHRMELYNLHKNRLQSLFNKRKKLLIL
jgi:hypothetical protein